MKYEALKVFTCANDASGIKGTDLKVGDLHEVPDGLVSGLLAGGYIRAIAGALDHDKNGKKGGSKEADTGNKVYTPAELLAAAEAEPPMEWNTLKAEAQKLLGDEMPSKKAEVIDALKTLVAAQAA